MTSDAFDFPVLVEMTRGDVFEFRHRGAVAVVEPEGRLAASLGPLDVPCYLRSAAKPFQAVTVFLSGAVDAYEFTPEDVALICASHNGEPFHVERVRSILARVGCSEDELRCGVHGPFNKASAASMQGHPTQPVHNNCSGKHSGMLAAARVQGLPTQGYEPAEHPVQQSNAQIVSAFTGVAPEAFHTSLDGCTVPTWAVPLRAVALAYARLARPETVPEFADHPRRDDILAAVPRITAAMTAHPELVGGTDRIDTDIMRALPGKVLSKVGADGIHALTVMPCDRFPSGLGIAVKIEDGDNARARNPVVLAVLEQLGVLSPEAAVPLDAKYRRPILTHRKQPVGETRVVFRLK